MLDNCQVELNDTVLLTLKLSVYSRYRCWCILSDSIAIHIGKHVCIYFVCHCTIAATSACFSTVFCCFIRSVATCKVVMALYMLELNFDVYGTKYLLVYFTVLPEIMHMVLVLA